MQIEESTYAAVITGQTIESGTSQDGRRWERLRLYVDVCRGVCKGYFSLLKQEYPSDRYRGTVDTYYAPEGVVLTDTQQQQLNNNIQLICKYNNIDKLPEDMRGLIVGIRITKDELGIASVSNWLVDGVDTLFCDTDLSNYYDPQTDIDRGPRTLPSLSSHGKVVNPKTIDACGGLAARRRAAAEKHKQEEQEKIEREEEEKLKHKSVEELFGVEKIENMTEAIAEEKNKKGYTVPPPRHIPYNPDYRVRAHQTMLQLGLTDNIDNTAYNYLLGQAECIEHIGDTLRELETPDNQEIIRKIAYRISCVKWW